MPIRLTGVPSTRTDRDNSDARKTGAHRYWRLRIAGNGGDDYAVRINKLRLFEAVDLVNVCTDNGDTDLYTASSTLTGTFPDNPFSGLEYAEFYWQSDQIRTTYSPDVVAVSFPVYLTVEFVDAKDIARATLICSGNDITGVFNIGGMDSAPTLVDVQYSDDGEVWFTRMGGELTWPVDPAADEDVPTSEYYQSLDALYGVSSTLPLLAISAAGLTGDFQEFGADLTLPALTCSAIINNESAELPSLSVTGVGAVGNASQDFLPIELPGLTASGVLAPGQYGHAQATLPGISLEANGYQTGDLVGLVLPSLSVTAVGAIGAFGSGAPILPSLSIEAAGYGDNDLQGAVLPSLGVASAGISGSFGPVYATLPSLVIDITLLNGEDQFSLPSLSVTGTGVIGVPALFYGYLPALTAEATGVFSAPDVVGDGAISAALPSLSADSYGVRGNNYEASNALPALTLAANGVTGVQGTAQITLPALSAQGTMISAVNADIVLSLPALQVYASSTPALGEVATGQAVTMNVKHKAITEFTAYGFNSYAQFAGLKLACSDVGLFSLVGDDDNGAIIAASIELGKHDFDVQQLKSVDQLYVGYQSSGDLLVTAQADDGKMYSYTLERQQADTGRHTAKTKLGRGLKGRYFKFGIQNVAGASFSIDTLEPEPRVLKRRIR